MRYLLLFGVLAAALALAVPAYAGPPAADTGANPDNEPGSTKPADDGEKPERKSDWDDRDVHELVETVMMVRLGKAVQLTDEQTVAVAQSFQEYRKQIHERYQARRAMHDALRTKLDEGAPETDIRAALDPLLRFDEDIAKLRREGFEAAAKAGGLSALQEARLYWFLEDFEDNMRKMVMRARERRYGDRGEGERDGESDWRRPESREGSGDAPEKPDHSSNEAAE